MRSSTRLLLVVAGVVAVVDLAVRFTPRGAPPALPSLAGFSPDAVARLELGGTDGRTVLERRGDRWWSVSVDGPADAAEVAAALGALADGVRPGARVDEGDHDRYGLAGGDELRVDVVGASGPLSSLLVGRDAGGGDTWVRFPGDEAVYRADIGGRGLYDRPPGAWRDRTVVRVDPALVTAVVLRAGGREVRAERRGAGWSEGVDAERVEQLVRLASDLRAAEVVDAGPDGLAELELVGPEPVLLRFGEANGRTVVRREGRPEVWRVVAPWVARLAEPEAFADRAVWSVPASAVTAVRVEGPGWDGWIRREADGALRLVRPANLVIDPQRLAAAVALVASPRVLAWQQVDGDGFDGRRLVVEVGGDRRVLEFGATVEGRIQVRDAAAPGRIGWFDAGLLAKLLTVFGA